ncbi:MAG: hypothetical protein FH749_04930 [Firmicutes bacterium]|nr:hypothetical protein [Bacillota bacterium]
MTDPYKQRMFKSDPYFAKVNVTADLVVVLTGQYENRNLKLIGQPSRAVSRYQVHELIVTDQHAKPGDIVNPIAYLGFVEFTNSGVLVAGDQLKVDGEVIGTIVGFDETHMPNHLNIVLHGQRICGKQRGLELGQQLKFVKPPT